MGLAYKGSLHNLCLFSGSKFLSYFYEKAKVLEIEPQPVYPIGHWHSYQAEPESALITQFAPFWQGLFEQGVNSQFEPGIAFEISIPVTIK